MLPASQERSHEKLTRIVRTNVRQRSQRTADPSAQAVRGAVGLHPENLLRQARRQKRLPDIAVPDICILDPDGDIVRNLCAAERARRHGGWACYHTELYVFRRDGHEYGIVGCAVGAAFAVLIAEELFASGCRLLVSITSAGQIAPVQATPYFVVIDRALRDEGTSYHYLPASEYSEGDVNLTELARAALSTAGMSVRVGASWTTDAPFRKPRRQ